MSFNTSYHIVLTRTAQKELADLSPAWSARFVKAIDKLKGNPHPRGVQKLKGRINDWRIRIGRFRILYSINDPNREIAIFRITDRKEIYRKL